jgi:hypothetical protein
MLSLVTRALLESWHRDALATGKEAKAAALRRLAASDAPVTARQELGKRSRVSHDYLHPMLPAVIWRDRELRRDVERLLREHPQHRRAMKWFQYAASNEGEARDIRLAMLVERLADLASRPLESNRVRRRRQLVAELQNRDLAEEAEVIAILSTVLQTGPNATFRSEAERKDVLILATRWCLGWDFGMRGDGVIAQLVGTVLGWDPLEWKALAERARYLCRSLTPGLRGLRNKIHEF